MTAGTATLVELTMADLLRADLERASARPVGGLELDALRETAVGRAFGITRADLTPDGRLMFLHLTRPTRRQRRGRR